MHQPQYRHAVDGHYLRPWTWLHAIKDYADMAAHLETVPGARAVVNFSTILLEQLEDYAARIERWRIDGLPVGDRLLDALGGRIDASPAGSLTLAETCLHANEAHMIRAFEPFAELCDAARAALAEGVPLDDATLFDLVVWYHLAWTGESLRREQPLVRELQNKARSFTSDDGKQLLVLIGNVLRDLIPRYRRLSESGAVELSVTPHAHPILPLLVDTGVAREAMPQAPLPTAAYPGGVDRCRWHIERALAEFERHFGHLPTGCWPSEGGLSSDVVALLGEAGFAWTATGTRVLQNSLGGDAVRGHFQAWRLPGARRGTTCFFRDDDLSDRVGFRYSTWAADHAVDDFIAHLEAVLRDWQAADPPVVSVIMDGENAWEHYPYNAWFFLQHFYTSLAGHEQIELTTYRDLLADGIIVGELPKLVAGSWVYGDFAVWIGDPQKNRAWEHLAAAKRATDRVLAAPETDDGARDAILEQLGVCEGSDWFWWLGRDNRPEDSIEFDGLFREHLDALYRLLGEPVPGDLQPIATSSDATADQVGGTMRRAGP